MKGDRIYRKSTWAILERSRCRLDGYREWLRHDHTAPAPILPMLFATRDAARAEARRKNDWLRTRPDLTREPHGWLPARVVRLHIEAEFDEG